MEYTYGSMEGLIFTLQSIQALRKYEIDLALPSHGEPITTPDEDIDLLETRIMSCVRLGRGLHVAGETSLPEPSFLPEFKLYEISPHLLWGGPATCSNFYVVVSESRKALFIDYGQAFVAHLHMFADHEGLETMRFVEHRLDELRETWGVEDIDVVIPTHIHDDHTCGIPYLQRHHGTECWALDLVADVLESPADWASTPCLFPEPIVVQRRLTDGERFTWEEFEFSIYHAPGQTEWHATIVAMIDGTKVAFTGDNYLLAEVVVDGNERTLPYQTTVMRNSFQLAMHRQCATLMRELSPQLICPGHGELLSCDSDDIDAYCEFVTRKETVFRDLVGEPADHYIDLFWARLLPYLKTARPGERVGYRLILRNNLGRGVIYGARLHVPLGWSTSGQFEHLALQAGERGTLWLWAEAPKRGDGTRRLVTAEVQLDGKTLGPVVEALVEVETQSSGSVR
jgi:glyoxylase-like metal-dependent hydrolase (beta-lactamase superfamily II)